MNFIERRYLYEVITMYSLEPFLEDIYVEGADDFAFYSEYYNGNHEVRFIEINQIDFNELYPEKPYLRCNNHDKIIELSIQLFEKFNNQLGFVICIADLDFNSLEKVSIWNSYLFYTDYNSLELYFFNKECLDRLLKIMFHKYSVNSENLLASLVPILRFLFILRYELYNLPNPKYLEPEIVDIRRSLTIDIASGQIIFNDKEYLDKIFNANYFIENKFGFKETIYRFLNISPSDPRLEIRGHDFIKVLYLFIKKIDNNLCHSEEQLGRTLQLCVSRENLKNNRLFNKIRLKYSYLSQPSKTIH